MAGAILAQAGQHSPCSTLPPLIQSFGYTKTGYVIRSSSARRIVVADALYFFDWVIWQEAASPGAVGHCHHWRG